MSLDHPPAEEDRPVLRSILRGWTGRCPHCDSAPLFARYLQVRDHCEACGEAFHHHRADDLPAWGAILIVGHLLASAILTIEQSFRPPYWVHVAVWPILGLGLCLVLLPRLKGAVVGMQWANRMHGFGVGN